MLRRALALAALLIVCGCAPSAEAKPPVWIVRDADSEMVLFGSVHVLPPGLDWRPLALTRALAKADDLWFELPVDAATELEAAQLAARDGLLAPGQSLSALLTPQGAERLEAAVRRFSLAPALVDRMEPWLAEVAISGAVYRAAGAVAGAGVEKQVAAEAPPGARRRAFETASEQIAFFDGAPLAEQVASLEETLAQLETDEDAFKDLVDSWMAADLARIEQEALAPLKAAAPALYERVVVERNRRWAVELDERLKGEGETVVVVGVGHLIGEEGLPARLRALGYSVEGP